MRNIAFSALILAMLVWNITLQHKVRSEATQTPQIDTIYVVDEEWTRFVLALISIESGYDVDAENQSGAAGLLQLMPVYVKEVNRILGEERYSAEDRYDARKCLEMFQIMQNAKNPDHDVDTAIKMHNPRAGKWYGNRIKKEMKGNE